MENSGMLASEGTGNGIVRTGRIHYIDVAKAVAICYTLMGHVSAYLIILFEGKGCSAAPNIPSRMCSTGFREWRFRCS